MIRYSDYTLTTGAVARLLGKSQDTVSRWADSGLIRHIRTTPEGHRRFRQEDVDRFIRGRLPAAEAADR